MKHFLSKTNESGRKKITFWHLKYVKGFYQNSLEILFMNYVIKNSSLFGNECYSRNIDKF